MDISRLLATAEEIHRSGEFKKAAVAYRKILQHDPDHPDAFYGLGTLAMQRADWVEAGEFLQRAVRLAPKVPEFRLNLSLTLEEMGKLRQAKAGYLAAAALSNGFPGILMPICGRLLHLGMAKEAYHWLEESGSSEPSILTLKAEAQGAMGNWGGAVSTLRGLTKQKPEDARTWRELATAAGYLRDYDTAIAAYETYLSLKTPVGEEYLAYADLLLMARRLEEAKHALEKSLRMGVERAEARHMAAKCARLAGDPAGARQNLLLAIEKRPAFGQAWDLLLETADEAELPALADRCRRLADEASGTDRDQILLALAAGRALEKLEQYEQAFEAFLLGNERHKALLSARDVRYDPTHTERLLNRIIALFDAPQERSAEEGPTRPIFILGMPRSGTTLVEKILACLDGVEAGGENESLEFVAAQYYWDLEHGRSPTPKDLSEESWRSLVSQYWRGTPRSSRFLTDKMPHNFRHVGLIAAMFPRAPILHVRRDPRDVCLSVYSRMFPDGHRYACDLSWLGHFYAQSIRIMDHWKRTFPHRVLEIMYEDLVRQPEAQTRAVAEFCGLEWRAQCLRFHDRTTSSFTFSELQVREPLNASGVGRWIHYEKQLQPLTSVLAEHGIL